MIWGCSHSLSWPLPNATLKLSALACCIVNGAPQLNSGALGCSKQRGGGRRAVLALYDPSCTPIRVQI